MENIFEQLRETIIEDKFQCDHYGITIPKKWHKDYLSKKKSWYYTTIQDKPLPKGVVDSYKYMGCTVSLFYGSKPMIKRMGIEKPLVL